MAFVFDGDTVRLADGRHVRLLGIDTPEIGRDGAPSEPFAIAARDFLRALIGKRDVRLVNGKRLHDRYGRQLSELVLPDGRNVQRELLARGLAVVMAVESEVPLIECLVTAERRARAARAGVWSVASYGPIDADRVVPGSRGFRLVRGRVTAVRETRSSLWLEMGDAFSARVPRRSIDAFGRERLLGLVGRSVIVRGYLYGDRRRRHVTLHHPAMLESAD